MPILTYGWYENTELFYSPRALVPKTLSLIPAWLTSACDEIRRLADRPWPRFFLLLAMTAVVRPCSITTNDARWHRLQSLNQADAGADEENVVQSYGSPG